jgi:predicted membrane protein
METRIARLPSDTGVGRLKIIFVLLVLGAIAYTAIKVVPVYMSNYEVADYIRQLAIKSSVERVNAETVRDHVVKHARDQGLPVTNDNVTVTITSGKVRIDMDYSVPIDLKVYTWVLHFTPSSEDVL